MWLAHIEDYENPENAQWQFKTIISNCEHILGTNNYWKTELDITPSHKNSLDTKLENVKGKWTLQLAAILQKKLVTIHLMSQEWYDFRYYDKNANTVLEDIQSYSEKYKADTDFQMFLDAQESFSSWWKEPPYESMINAQDYFKNLAQMKLEADLAENYVKFRVPDKYKNIFKDRYIPKKNDKWRLWEPEELDAEGIKIKISKTYKDTIKVVEIAEWDFAWEQFFHPRDMKSQFHRQTAFFDARDDLPNQNHIDNSEFIEAFLESVNDFPWVVELDESWEVCITGMGEKVRYAFVEKGRFEDKAIWIEVYKTPEENKEYSVFLPEEISNNWYFSLKQFKK